MQHWTSDGYPYYISKEVPLEPFQCKPGIEADSHVIAAVWTGEESVQIFVREQSMTLSLQELDRLLTLLQSLIPGSFRTSSQKPNQFSPPKKQDPSWSGRLVDGQIGQSKKQTFGLSSDGLKYSAPLTNYSAWLY